MIFVGDGALLQQAVSSALTRGYRVRRSFWQQRPPRLLLCPASSAVCSRARPPGRSFQSSIHVLRWRRVLHRQCASAPGQLSGLGGYLLLRGSQRHHSHPARRPDRRGHVRHPGREPRVRRLSLRAGRCHRRGRDPGHRALRHLTPDAAARADTPLRRPEPADVRRPRRQHRPADVPCDDRGGWSDPALHVARSGSAARLPRARRLRPGHGSRSSRRRSAPGPRPPDRGAARSPRPAPGDHRRDRPPPLGRVLAGSARRPPAPASCRGRRRCPSRSGRGRRSRTAPVRPGARDGGTAPRLGGSSERRAERRAARRAVRTPGPIRWSAGHLHRDGATGGDLSATAPHQGPVAR